MLNKNGYQFIEETKLPNISESDQSLKKPQPPYETPFKQTRPLIDLPKPEGIDFGQYDLRKAIEIRRSLRRYSDDFISLQELSYLLWLTQGVKSIDEKRHVTWRTVPSAGCRHPFETYLSINRVEGLEPGLYRYLALDHKIAPIRLDNQFTEELAQACGGQRQVLTSAVTFIWAAVPYRTVWRYSERSYRYMYLDAGHVCQNLHLVAESLNCGVCAIGYFDDDAVDVLVELTPPDMFVIYMASLGRRIPRSE